MVRSIDAPTHKPRARCRLQARVATNCICAFALLLALLDATQAAPSHFASNVDIVRQVPSMGQDIEPQTSSLSRDKWIGLGLAVSSSLAIGTSFIITKKASGRGDFLIVVHSC